MLGTLFGYCDCDILHNGIRTKVRSYSKDHITQSFRKQTFYEADLLCYLKSKISPASNIIDAGAFVGNHSLFFAQHINANLVHAFEPFPKTFRILKRNISSNHLEKVIHAHNYALSDSEYASRMTCSNKKNQGMNHLDQSGKTRVNVTSLDKYLARQLNSLDLIKIDTEGHGLKVLDGAMSLISEHLPLLCIEIHPEPLDEFVKLLEPLGYQITEKFNSTPTYVFEPKARDSRSTFA